MDHAVDLAAVSVEDAFDDGDVGAGGGENELARVDAGKAGDGVGETARAGVDVLVGDGVVVALGVFVGQVFGEDVVAGGGESVGAHAAVVGGLVGGLAEGGEADDDIAGADAGVVHHVGAAHAASDGGVDDDGAHEVAHVGGFSAGGVDVDTEAAVFLDEFLGAVDDGGDDLAGDEFLVAPDGGGEEYVVDGPDTEKVVDVHDEGVLGDSFPHGKVTGLAPIHVGERGFGAGSVGVHDVAVVGVAAEVVGDDFAERFGEDSLVYVFDGVVHVFFGGGHAAPVVSFVLSHAMWFYGFPAKLAYFSRRVQLMERFSSISANRSL